MLPIVWRQQHLQIIPASNVGNFTNGSICRWYATSNAADFTMAAFVDNVLPVMLLLLQMVEFADNMLSVMLPTLQVVVFVDKMLPASNATNCSRSKVVASFSCHCTLPFQFLSWDACTVLAFFDNFLQLALTACLLLLPSNSVVTILPSVIVVVIGKTVGSNSDKGLLPLFSSIAITRFLICCSSLSLRTLYVPFFHTERTCMRVLWLCLQRAS